MRAGNALNARVLQHITCVASHSVSSGWTQVSDVSGNCQSSSLYPFSTTCCITELERRVIRDKLRRNKKAEPGVYQPGLCRKKDERVLSKSASTVSQHIFFESLGSWEPSDPGFHRACNCGQTVEKIELDLVVWILVRFIPSLSSSKTRTLATLRAILYLGPSFSSSASTQSVMQGLHSAYKHSTMPRTMSICNSSGRQQRHLMSSLM